MATYCPEDLASRELACPICFEDYNNQNAKRTPKLLPCLHTFCRDCTKKLRKRDGSIECSMCRMLHEEVKLDDLLDNYVIVEHLREKLEKQDFELAMRIDQGLCDSDISISSRNTRPRSRQSSASASSRPSSVNSRHSSVNSRHSSVNSRHSSVNSRHSSVNSRHSSVNSRHSSVNSRHSSVNSRHSSVNSRHSSVYSRHSSVYSRHSSSNSWHSSANSRHSSASSRHSRASSRHSSVNSRHSSANSRHSSASSRHSSASSRHISASSRHSSTSSRHSNASSRHSSASSTPSSTNSTPSKDSSTSSNEWESNFTSISSGSSISSTIKRWKKKMAGTTKMTRDAGFAWSVMKHSTAKPMATRRHPNPSTPLRSCIQPTKKRQRQAFVCSPSRQEPSSSYRSSPLPPPRKCKRARRFSNFQPSNEELAKMHRSIASLQATVIQVTAAIQQRKHPKQHAHATAVSRVRSRKS